MDAMASPEDLVQIEVRSDGDGWWSNTPWWMVSAGLHLRIQLIATMLSIERLRPTETPVVEVKFRAPLSSNLHKELVRDVEGFDRKPLSTEREDRRSSEAP